MCGADPLTFDYDTIIQTADSYRPFGRWYRNGVWHELRLYSSVDEARKHATLNSPGFLPPIHHGPHKRGYRFHFHPHGHTVLRFNGRGQSRRENLHFMYGRRIIDQQVLHRYALNPEIVEPSIVFQSDSGHVSDSTVA